MNRPTACVDGFHGVSHGKRVVYLLDFSTTNALPILPEVGLFLDDPIAAASYDASLQHPIMLFSQHYSTIPAVQMAALQQSLMILVPHLGTPQTGATLPLMTSQQAL